MSRSRWRRIKNHIQAQHGVTVLSVAKGTGSCEHAAVTWRGREPGCHTRPSAARLFDQRHKLSFYLGPDLCAREGPKLGTYTPDGECRREPVSINVLERQHAVPPRPIYDEGEPVEAWRAQPTGSRSTPATAAGAPITGFQGW